MGYRTSSSRREFVRQMSALLASGAASGFLPQLGLVGQALATTGSIATNSYRALVCVYLAGGNDGYNVLVPIDDTGYANYKTARSGLYDAATNPGGLAFPRAQDPQTATNLPPLLPLTLAAGTGTYGINPYCPELQALFNAQRLAFVANIGTLVQPITKTQYNNGSVPKPPQLYSHNDQENLWHLARTDANFRYGWGGQSADFVNSLNSGNAISALSPCISIAGANKFEIGTTLVPYQMGSGGVTQLSGYYTSTNAYSNALKNTLAELLALNYDSVYSDEYQATLSRSTTLGVDLSARLASANGTLSPDRFAGFPPANSLAAQLRMVARMIKICSDPAVGIQRQIFYVRVGSFDTHTGQNTAPANALGGQGLLLQYVSQTLKAFDDTLKDLTLDGNVLTFTMSEFSRTLSSNGNGTDHAWGGIQMIMGNGSNTGGNLLGGCVYGTYPELVLNLDDTHPGSANFSRGQFIPTTAVEQMMGTLSTWLGVPGANLGAIYPNLANFGGSAGLLPLLA